MKTVSKPKRSKKQESVYIFTNSLGEGFHGTLDQYQQRYCKPSNEASLIQDAKEMNCKLQKRYKRANHTELITVTLHDPVKPEKMEFVPRKYGSKAGKSDRLVEYTDCDGRKYRIWLKFSRDSEIDAKSPMNHKHEVEYRILGELVKAFGGKEPDL